MLVQRRGALISSYGVLARRRVTRRRHLAGINIDLAEMFAAWAPTLLCGAIPFPRPTVVWVLDVAALHGWAALLVVFFALLRLIEADLMECRFTADVHTYLTKFPRRSVLMRRNLVREVCAARMWH